MVKLIYFIVLTHFFRFHQIKILRQPRLLTFLSYTNKKKLQCSNHNIFSFVKSTQIIYLVEITYNFEFLMVKLIYFIVLTHFFQFNQLKMLRQPGYLLF